MRRDPVFWVSAVALGIILLAAVFAERLAPYGPNEQDILKRLQPPGIAGHVLGTDEVGRDILSRLIHGARISLLIGVIAVGLSCPLGVLVGLVAGYAGRRTDDVLMHITDIQLAIPTILLAIAVVAVLGPGLPNVIITLSVTGWTLYARLVRGQTMTVKTREFVQAARANGAGDTRIVLRHVLPNVFSPVIVGGLRGGQHDRAGGHPVVPGPGRGAERRDLGPDAERGSALPQHRVVAHRLPRPRDLRHGTGGEPAGRPPARLARPAPARLARLGAGLRISGRS